MAYLEVTTRNDLPSFKYVISLDNVNYLLTYTYNARMSKWFVSISDQTGTIIASQVPLVATWPLFNRFVALAVPPGVLFPFDSSNTNTDPGRYDLGDRVRMIYAEQGTL